MAEEFPQDEQIAPPVEISENGVIAGDEGAVQAEQTAAMPVDPTEHGGYAAGVRVGEMAGNIARLQAQGRFDEAKALSESLNAVTPGIPVEK